VPRMIATSGASRIRLRTALADASICSRACSTPPWTAGWFMKTPSIS